MQVKLTILLSILSGLAVNVAGFAQCDHTPVPAGQNGLGFTEFVSRLESRTELRFFFQPDWVSGLPVIQGPADTLLDQVLDKTLKDRNLYYACYRNQIILTRDAPVATRIGQIKTVRPVVETAEAGAAEGSPASNGPVKLTIGSVNRQNGSRNAIVSGHVTELKTGEPLIGVNVYSNTTQTGTTTDLSGYYRLSLPRGEVELMVSTVGMKREDFKINLLGDGTLDVELKEEIIQLRGAEIIAEKDKNVTGIQLGQVRLETKTIKKIPTMAGEVDILKSALLLPGVQTVGEGASGFNVRGGSTDQNLILLNDIPVFNSSHLFGFFSSFNPDIVRDFNLYKSGIPAEYGGRISSVFDVNMSKGNAKRFSGSVGLSPVTARGMIEGPVVKDKGSFIISGRSTYSDWILRRINNPGVKESSAYFYDLNLNASLKVNDKNEISLSAYYSYDYFKLKFDTVFNYRNQGASVKWKHNFNRKLMAELTGIYSYYNYTIRGEQDNLTTFEQRYSIDHREIAAGLTWFPGISHKVKFGFNGIYYSLLPGVKEPLGAESLVVPVQLETENAIESSIYLSDEVDLSQRLKLYAGIRYSNYFFMGPQTVYQYAPGQARELLALSDTLIYGQNQLIQYYGGPELRISLRYRMGTNNSVKLSYNRSRQYLHMLTNTTAISPTDTWKLSDPHIRPQLGDQYSIGYFQDFKNNTIQSSVEVYYRKISDFLEYKSGAELLLNDKIEVDLINAKGNAYGAELMVEKKFGRLNGWASYTYARTLVKAESQYPGEEINRGEYFPANHDKPHDVTLVANYQITRRFSAGANMTYSTGRPITYPAASYTFQNIPLVHYTNRNEYRIPDYFRLDLSLNLDGNLKSKKIAHSFWSLSVYNLTGRDNVYSVYFINEGGKTQGYKLSVFTRPVFTLSFNMEF